MEKCHQMFQQIAPNNIGNNRYLILGSSNSGKTTLSHILIGFDLRKHRKITFLEGGKSQLLDEMENIYKKANIEIVRLNLTVENIQEILNKVVKLIDEETKRDELIYQLFVIDDITHLIKDSTKLSGFLNKMYTTSRQAGYDVITILHGLKLGNTIMRNNCSKIFITSTDEQYLQEFKDIIKDTNVYPIVIDCSTSPHRQIKLNLEMFNDINLTQFIARIGLKSPSAFPQIRRSKKLRNVEYIEVDNPQFETFQTTIPRSFWRFKKNSMRQKAKLSAIEERILRERRNITDGENHAVHPIIHKKTDKTENSSINWDNLYNITFQEHFLTNL